MTHQFIVSTENVNEYGYRILTAGIDVSQYERNPVVLYGHVRAFDDPKRVIGRCVKLWKEDGKLLAEIEFDEADEFAKEIAGKVERGYIRMASLHADVVETSLDSSLTLPNQIMETVTKCKLIEISIVDVGGNNDALKLSRNGSTVELRKLKSEYKNVDMSLKTIALSLALSANADENAVLDGIENLKKKAQEADKRAETAEQELEAQRVSEAETIVTEAVELGLLPEVSKPAILLAFKNDHNGQKESFAKLIADKKAELKQEAGQGTVAEIVLGAKGTKPNNHADAKECFDYLQKHDPIELKRINAEEPERYVKLAKAYGQGKRYVEQVNTK
ncbi:HK97 family phage prohead protease [Weeksella virosa]|uniref:Prohead serine protease domain-containing protein n=1 Tax=Weeksella virosa (strain ATCC 43766 / DSM 16922 / JCM 21250 / CCUG 30538 / CDC 9751 / IAM 14551 / NBRC 16016 / NCTC 11634 / CL345/78) TaxID=865938 RepID=F0P2V1_WEEVC|nr:HK97 family phage prohead protease [Weeksella virosa]ADX66841.1 hypothetical protein Weevi_0115 [Weeksella virosa DSM 16922]VEH63435.1 Caudovirus prohead protease [Weeksella virosa]